MMSLKRLKQDSDEDEVAVIGGVVDENSRSSAPFEHALLFRRDIDDEEGHGAAEEKNEGGEDDDDDDDSPYEDEDDGEEEDSENPEVSVGNPEEEEHVEGELHEWEICTRSRQPFTEQLELGEDFFEQEMRKVEEDEEENEAAVSSVTSSIASDDDDDEDDEEEFQGDDDVEDIDDAPRLWELLNSDDEDDEDDEEYKWNEENEDDEDGEEDEDEDEDDDDHLVVSDSELEDLKRHDAPATLLQPQDVKRIREALRCHVQLLAQLMMLGASSSQPSIAQVCARMLEDIVHLGRKANLADSIMKGANPVKIESLLERYKQELQNPSALDNPTWRQPISPRFDAILAAFAPDLGFIRDLYPNLRRQKMSADRKRKNWRNWSDAEINLVVLGFNKYGGKARGVAQKIHEDFLPTREPHTITRIVCEAQGKKRCDERFQPIITWFQKTESSRLTEDEERRLLHGVALQQVKAIDKIDFSAISTSLLPHISASVLRKKMEDILLREYQEKQNELMMRAAALQQNRNNNNNAGMNSLLKAVASTAPLPSTSIGPSSTASRLATPTATT